MYKDTKHLCEDFIIRERDESQILKWVSCQNGHRLGSFYKCKLFHELMCPYHWKPTFN
jgi:hypothetical protein